MPIDTAIAAATRSATSPTTSDWPCRRSARSDWGGSSTSAGRPQRSRLRSRAYGRMAEMSPGKDSVTGHWELMGLVLERPFPVFPHGFPAELIAEFERRIGRATLGNIVASGTAIIDELGARAHGTGQADRLHVGRQRLSDRRARRGRAGSRAVSHLRDRLRARRRSAWASAGSSRGRSSDRPARSNGPRTAATSR